MEQGEYPGDASGSAPWENVEESPPLPFPQRATEHSRYYSPGDRFATTNGDVSESPVTRDDAWSCVIVLVAFWVFVAMTLVFGVYAPETLQLGPSSSVLIKPNNLFVDSVKVLELQPAKGSMLYGFHKSPPLDVAITWSETHKISLPVNTHKEWIYYLNEGSQINMSYSVSSLSSPFLVFVVAQGKEDFDKWLQDPSYPNSTLLWNIIHENGTIQMNVQRSYAYYIAMGNLNFETVKVRLNISIRAFLFNTTEPYYKCVPAQGECSFKLSFLGDNAAVLTSPGRKPGVIGGDCYVKVSYESRWITYLVSVGGMTLLVLVINKFLNKSQHTEQVTGRDQVGARGSERNPLLSSKDSDLGSGDSSYVSDADDEERVEEAYSGGGMGDEKPIRDGEYRNSSRRLCAICFSAPRDCFFIPCGHCVACFGCATRIGETSGACPICRRSIKKVRKIYTV